MVEFFDEEDIENNSSPEERSPSMRKTTKVRFDVDMDEKIHNGYQTNDVTSTLKVQTHEERGMMDRNRKQAPSHQSLHYPPQYKSPTQAQPPSKPYVEANGVDVKYISMINSLKDELAFLEESSSNLLVELRESQDANYVLTEEMRRIQRSNLNTLDELQACQTANTVLRQELQRLEQQNVKVTKDAEKYKKANHLLREELKGMKSSHINRKNSIQMVREKAKDLQNDLLEKEKDYQELASLKHAINIIVDTVESDSFNTENGYYPTDSDTLSTDGGDENLDAFTPTPVRKEKISPLSIPIGRKFTQRQATTPDYKHEQNGLFGRRHKELYSDFEDRRHRSQSLNMSKTSHIDDDNPQSPIYSRVEGRRRGSFDSFDKSESKRVDLHKELLTHNAEKTNMLSYSAEQQNNRANLKLDLNGNLESQTTTGKIFSSIPEILVDFCSDNENESKQKLVGDIRLADRVDHNVVERILKQGLFGQLSEDRPLVSILE